MRFFVGAISALFAASCYAGTTGAVSLDNAYHQMYNLQFADAHETLRQWRTAHPEDALGPVSDAAAYLFSEFDRLHILQSELFTDDDHFRHRTKTVSDPAARQAFENDLTEGERLAATALAKNPQDDNATFAKVLECGLRADYLALIEKRSVASLGFTKTGRALAEQLLSRNPNYYDAYLAVGVENYLLGINAAPVRWVLHLAGAETDKAEGIAKLRLTAQKGHLLMPFARLMLAVAALRDKDRGTAKQLLAGLVQEFPQNSLYARELARLN
ncbi:MAG TPA: hypothetical protein VKU01_02505 [Bryobacteraceae bacterium]|nr:hypothetical protein [Bryobacteraceae bacterium]